MTPANEAEKLRFANDIYIDAVLCQAKNDKTNANLVSSSSLLSCDGFYVSMVSSSGASTSASRKKKKQRAKKKAATAAANTSSSTPSTHQTDDADTEDNNHNNDDDDKEKKSKVIETKSTAPTSSPSSKVPLSVTSSSKYRCNKCGHQVNGDTIAAITSTSIRFTIPMYE
jgi:(p)ppGpp synthase/HD superfamily hydrolase